MARSVIYMPALLVCMHTLCSYKHILSVMCKTVADRMHGRDGYSIWAGWEDEGRETWKPTKHIGRIHRMSKKAWSCLKSQRRDNIGIAPILNEKGELCEDAEDKAEILSRQYTSVFTQDNPLEPDCCVELAPILTRVYTKIITRWKTTPGMAERKRAWLLYSRRVPDMKPATTDQFRSHRWRARYSSTFCSLRWGTTQIIWP